MTDVVFENVTKQFPQIDGAGQHLAVSDLNLTIPSGQMVTLLGPSGCGKTTTLRMLAGFETPTSGRIVMGGKDIARMPVNSRGIGMVFQSYALFPHLTVRQNIEYGLDIAKVRGKDKQQRVDAVMELMSLGSFGARSPSQLSGGQQQRVALARAVVTEPAVLLFDEPLSNLDAQLRERMRDELRAIQQRLEITSLYVTHDQDEAMAISDKVVIMKDGVVQQGASTRAVFTEPATTFVAEFIGNANLWAGAVVEPRHGEALVEASGRRFLARHDPEAVLRTGDAVSCVLRPEWISLRAESSAAARVERAVYYGSHVEYLVREESTATTVVTRIGPGSQVLEPGENVDIVVEPGSAWAIPERTS